MITFTLKDREIPLYFSACEMVDAQKQIAEPVSRIVKIILGKNPDDPEDTSQFGSANHLNAIAKLVCILGNAGLEETGEEPDLTVKDVLRKLKPAALSEIVSACLDAMNEGIDQETADDTENIKKV